MIHVGVCDQNVTNLPLFFDRECAGDGAGIDRNATIHQKGRHPALGAIAPKASQDPKFHALSITGTARVP